MKGSARWFRDCVGEEQPNARSHLSVGASPSLRGQGPLRVIRW